MISSGSIRPIFSARQGIELLRPEQSLRHVEGEWIASYDTSSPRNGEMEEKGETRGNYQARARLEYSRNTNHSSSAKIALGTAFKYDYLCSVQ